MNIKKHLPILEWLPNYKTEYLRGDISAGITVGIILIPQGMAYALIADLPPIYGLYATIVPLLIYAFLGTCRHLAVGAVALVSLLVASTLGAFELNSVEEVITYAITLSFLVGVLTLIMGIFRLGFLVNFLSNPVISGFTSAAALFIGFSQIKHILGIAMPRYEHLYQITVHVFQHLNEVNPATIAIGLGGILIIYLTRKYLKPIPATLLAVVLSILLVFILQQVGKVNFPVVGVIESSLPKPTTPIFDISLLWELMPFSFTIAIVGILQSTAIMRFAQQHQKEEKIRINQELIALGLANIGGSFFSAYPTTGGFSRTAVNIDAGAKTNLASFVAVGFIILSLLYLTPLFEYLPKAILASVIIVAVIKLIDIQHAIKLWKANRTDFILLIITFSGTLILGINLGILVGVLLSLGMMIFQTTRPHIAELGKVPNERIYRNIKRFENLEERKDLLIIRFDARLYFANTAFFLEEIQELIDKKGKDLKLFILDATSINDIDSTGLNALEELMETCNNEGIRFFMTSVKGPVRDRLTQGSFIHNFGKENFFVSVQHAVDFYDQTSTERLTDYTLQSNIE